MDAARAIIDANRYMTLATADAEGIPWASPVWYAPDGEGGFLWVSDPRTRHSRNLAQRSRLAIVIFNSAVVPGDAAALYMEAVGEQVDEGIETFSAHSVRQGLPEWTHGDVAGSARLRLYRAEVTDRWLLDAGDRRVRVTG